MTSLRPCAISVAVLFALALFGAAPALGATHTWIGPTNGAWSNPLNWSGGSIPTTGEAGGTIVQFSTGTSSSMDIAGLVVDEIHFTGANNTINGTTALGVNGSNLIENIVSDAGGNTLAASLPLALTGGAAPIEAVSGSGRLTIAGPVSGSPGLVFVGTGGDFALTGNNSYTGPTIVSSGTLHIASLVGFVIAGSSLTIGSPEGSSAQVVDDQSSDISPNTDVVVNSGGVFDFRSEIDTAKSLTVNGASVMGGTLTMSGPLTMTGGSVTISGGVVSAGSVSMTGGTISGPGTLALAGNFSATSSASGPASVSSGVQLKASPTFTVTPGAAPELRVSGVISEAGGSRSVTKAGTGTMLTSANNTYTGTTTVSAGALLANGKQVGALSVGQNGTLGGSGTFGATAVAGVLAPTAPGLHTGALTFGATGRLAVTINSLAPGAIPSVFVTGTVAIDPSAALNLVVAPGTAVPHGSGVPLIVNDAADPIAGQFAGVAENSVVTTPDGVPMVVNYAGGDGNDLFLTAGNIPPQISSITATPNPVAAGQPVAMSVTESDANKDPLVTTWNFGDGTTGTGTATSHAYTTPGSYTAIATVSDGLAQLQSATLIMVTASRGETPIQPRGTGTSKASGYGTNFVLTFPNACVRKGTPFNVTLTLKKKTKGRADASNRHVKVLKVVFKVAGKTLRTERSAPFRVRATLTEIAASGSRVNLSAKVYLFTIHGGKRRTKTIRVALRVC